MDVPRLLGVNARQDASLLSRVVYSVYLETQVLQSAREL